MNDILKTFLSMSVSGSLLLIILLAGRPLYRTRVSKRWQYYIYLVVIARLLLPFAPQRSLVGAFFERAQESFMNRLAEPRAGDYEDVDASANANVNADGEEAYADAGVVTRASSREPGRSAVDGENGKDSGERNREGWKRTEKIMAQLWSNLWLLWLGTALILFIRKITVYQSFVKYIKAGSREAEEIKLLEQLSEAGAELGMKRPVELYVNGLVSSPLLLGFFHPCIILSGTDWSEADFGYIVRHELVHYKRGDMIYKWLVQTVLCLHWFNPLVYRMEREIGRACELACDEAVLEMLDGKGRRSYGDMLLHAMEKGGSYKDSLASLTLNESAELLKERLGAIMDFKKISKGAKGCSLFLALLFATGAVEMGAYAGSGVSETALAEERGELDAQRIEEYLSYGITREGEAFYYQGKMVRILMDIRRDSSFVALEQNPRGEADIRIERDKSGAIESVRYLTQAEVKELFGDEEETDPEVSDEGNGDFSNWKEERNKGDLAEQAGVSRLKREELPESVTQAMQSCEVRTWYVICDDGEQYIYYNGFAWEYAYEPVRSDEGWRIRIERLRKKDSGYLLIRLSDEAPVTITCDGEEVVPKTVECEAADN